MQPQSIRKSLCFLCFGFSGFHQLLPVDSDPCITSAVSLPPVTNLFRCEEAPGLVEFSHASAHICMAGPEAPTVVVDGRLGPLLVLGLPVIQNHQGPGHSLVIGHQQGLDLIFGEH